MGKVMKMNQDIRELIANLRSKDGARRKRARETIIEIGKPAVPVLIELLADRNQHIRWEACKALGSIRDLRAAVPLVDALRDDSIEVQWLAAEGLIALGREAVVPLLRSLEGHFDSIFLQHGAHHVLHALERLGELNKKTVAVLDALRCLQPRSSIGVAAREALDSLNNDKVEVTPLHRREKG